MIFIKERTLFGQYSKMHPLLNTILIYARDMQKTAHFYQQYFDFESTGEVIEGLIELRAAHGGSHILIHQAAKSVKLGQASLKLMFDVADVKGFKEKSLKLGLEFGSTHIANGYAFANVKDPDGNSVAISSRAFR